MVGNSSQGIEAEVPEVIKETIEELRDIWMMGEDKDMTRAETQWERLSHLGMSKRPVMVFTLKILFGPEILFSICNTNRTVPGLQILGVFSWPSQTPLSCLPLPSLPTLVLLT